MNYEVYHIPSNFTDAGRIMGLFELRNLVEAVILTVPALYLCIAFLPFGLTAKIIVTLVVVVPVGGFGLIRCRPTSSFFRRSTRKITPVPIAVRRYGPRSIRTNGSTG